MDFKGIVNGARAFAGGLATEAKGTIRDLTRIGQIVDGAYAKDAAVAAENRALIGDMWRYTRENKGEVARKTKDLIIQPIIEDWRSGNRARAVGRATWGAAAIPIPIIPHEKIVRIFDAAELATREAQRSAAAGTLEHVAETGAREVAEGASQLL